MKPLELSIFLAALTCGSQPIRAFDFLLVEEELQLRCRFSTPCVPTPERWPMATTVFPYYINQDGCKAVDGKALSLEQIVPAITNAFAAWKATGIGIEFRYMGPTKAKRNQNDGTNTIFWDTTGKTVKKTALGKAFHRYLCSGDILDADIGFNATEIKPPSTNKTSKVFPIGWNVNNQEGLVTIGDQTYFNEDVQQVATHEIGHFLGLGHSVVPEATMTPPPVCCTKDQRSLDCDDIAGIWCLYDIPQPATFSVLTSPTCGGRVDLAWSAVACAAIYDIFEGDALVATVHAQSTTHETYGLAGLTPGSSHTYTIRTLIPADFPVLVLCDASVPVVSVPCDFPLSLPSTATASGPCAPPPRFLLGTRVRTTITVNVYAAPGFSSPIIGLQSGNRFGRLQAGPEYVDGHWWWYVNFELHGDGSPSPDGWTIEDYLILVTPPVIVPGEI